MRIFDPHSTIYEHEPSWTMVCHSFFHLLMGYHFFLVHTFNVNNINALSCLANPEVARDFVNVFGFLIEKGLVIMQEHLPV